MENYRDSANFSRSQNILVTNVDAGCLFFLILKLMHYRQNYFSCIGRNMTVALPHVNITLEIERFL